MDGDLTIAFNGERLARTNSHDKEAGVHHINILQDIYRCNGNARNHVCHIFQSEPRQPGVSSTGRFLPRNSRAEVKLPSLISQ